MQIALIGTVLQEMQVCALVMHERATYILCESPNLGMGFAPRALLDSVCNELISTRHDTLSGLGELNELFTSSPSAAEIESQVSFLMQRLQNSFTKINKIVSILGVAGKDDPDHQNGYILVSEAAANIGIAIKRVGEAVDSFFAETEAPSNNNEMTACDWPFSLSGDNLLVALKILYERFESNRLYRETIALLEDHIAENLNQLKVQKLIRETKEKGLDLNSEDALKQVGGGSVKKAPPSILVEEKKSNSLDDVDVIQVDITTAEVSRLMEERGPLSEELIHRIERIMPVFKDVYTPVFKGGSTSIRDGWIEGFNKDLNPEREVEIWEWIAKSLVTFAMSDVETFEQFEEAYKLLSSRTMKSKVDTMKEANLQILTADQVEYLLSAYA